MDPVISSGLFFKWSRNDLAILLILIGVIFSFWIFFGIWIVGICGIILIILGVISLIINFKSKSD